VNALLNNTDGILNTASGVDALVANTTGSDNTAAGFFALGFNTTGGSNTANGEFALLANTTGSNNTADGISALSGNTSGSSNIAVGVSAGANLTTGNNNIDIGNAGVAAEANTIRIGTSGTQTAIFIAAIRGVPITGAQPVWVNASGQLGVRASSVRFKEEIKPMDRSSEAILSLHPVSFRYKKELDPKGVPQFGLVAEEVAKVNPDLVLADEQGKPLSVRYEEINAMLLNEFLKEHKKVEAQQATIAELKLTVAQQQTRFAQEEAQIQALASGLQKVSARLEMSKSTQQVVLMNR
jgi:trimeric autotransporter adhesin